MTFILLLAGITNIGSIFPDEGSYSTVFFPMMDSIKLEGDVEKRAHSWDIQTLDSEGSVGKYSSIAIDSNDNIHISFFDDTNKSLKYAYFNGTAWTIENVSSNIGISMETSIAVDSQNRPHISYTTGALRYGFFNGNMWINELIDTDGRRYSSIAIDSNDLPHIAYFDDEASNGNLKYTYNNGSLWNMTIVDSPGTVGLWPSIKMDLSDHPHISYVDSSNQCLKYAYNNGITWHKEVVDTAIGLVGGYTSIAIDTNKYIHISYYKSLDYDLKYAYYNGSSWSKTIIDSNGDVGTDTSIALDSNERPHISYHDSTNSDVKYAYFNGTEWQTEAIDTIESDGFYTSLVLDSMDLPHISEYDLTNKDLKIAHLLDREPVANAGPDLVTDQHQEVTFVGSNCTDDFGIISYNWTFDYNGTIFNLTEMNSTFIFHIPGVYEVTLNVTDTRDNWDSDTMFVTVRDITPPVAVAEADNPIVDQYRTINFTSFKSTDNVGVTSYRWSFTYVSVHKTFNTMNFSYTFDIAGEYLIILNVTDDRDNWDVDHLIVRVRDIEKPELINDNSPSMGTTGDIFELNLSAADNVAMESVRIHWEHGTLGGNDTLSSTDYYWTGDIILDDDLGDLEYEIYIMDSSKNYLNSTVKTVPVIDNDLPNIEGDNTSVTGTTGEELLFRIKASDNIEVETVHLDWDQGTINGQIVLTEIEGIWIGNITLPHDIEDFIYTVTVTDTSNNSYLGPIRVVAVMDNDAPRADAGSDRVMDQSTNITLDGGASTDNIGIVNYVWSFIYDGKPNIYFGKAVTLQFNISGVYNITLNVTDGVGNFDADTVRITVLDSEPPVADISGKFADIEPGETVTFSGEGSTDNQGITNWTWNVTTPSGTYVRYGSSIDIEFEGKGTYGITLCVEDAGGNADSVSKTIIVGESNGKPDDDNDDDNDDGNNETTSEEDKQGVFFYIVSGVLALVIISAIVYFFVFRNRRATVVSEEVQKEKEENHDNMSVDPPAENEPQSPEDTAVSLNGEEPGEREPISGNGTGQP